MEPAAPNPTDETPIVEVALPAGLKPGYRSTEFWLTLLLIALDLAGAVSGELDPKVAGILATVTAACYKALRFALKMRMMEINAAQFPELSAELAARMAGESAEVDRGSLMVDGRRPADTIHAPNAAHDRSNESGFAQPRTLTAILLLSLALIAAGLLLGGCAVTLGADFGKGGQFTGGYIGIGGAIHHPPSTIRSSGEGLSK